MKEITFNNNNLTDTEIDKVVKKVRAVIINDRIGKILIVNYAGLYMLPGGKIDNNETEMSALKREILEESGIEITELELEPYLVINSYDKNYHTREYGTINRLTQTTFYVIHTDKEIDISKKKLTKSEIEKNHTITYEYLEVIEYLIRINNSFNPKRKQFDREILTALYECPTFKNKRKILTK